MMRAATRFLPRAAARQARLASAASTNAPLPPAFAVAPEVRAAIDAGAPVVALESTIIAHGMPFPQNLDMARGVEATVRARGAVPATVAVVDGAVRVGLDGGALERLARAGPGGVRKCSRRDLALCAAQGALGATTVSGTMVAAEAAGISVFVTGGIGGVHRGGEDSLDVSADLAELGRTPVAVVCAGVKSILDVPRTLEYLETQGVAVLGWRTDTVPNFFCDDSGIPLPQGAGAGGARCDDAAAVARVLRASFDGLALRTGVVVAVPNPEPAADAAAVDAAVATALREADAAGVAGKAVTPFLLKRVNELTGGGSLEANLALVRHNARVGADVAVELAALRRAGEGPGASGGGGGGGGGASGSPLGGTRAFSTSTSSAAAAAATAAAAAASASSSSAPSSSAPVVVVGGITVDLVAAPDAGAPFVMGSSNPGTVNVAYGGVARNVAEAMARLGAAPRLVSAVGDAAGDGGHGACPHADGAVAACAGVGMRVGGGSVRRAPGVGTAVYSAALDDAGDLVVAYADMAAMAAVTPEHVALFADEIARAPLVVADGNPPAAALRRLVALAQQPAQGGLGGSRVPVWFEPTSVAKARKALDPGVLPGLDVITPNEDELRALASATMGVEDGSDDAAALWAGARDEEEGLELACGVVLDAMSAADGGRRWKHLVVTRGARGVLVASRGPGDELGDGESDSDSDGDIGDFAGSALRLMYLDGEALDDVVNCTGAGDTLVGAMAAYIASGEGADAGSPAPEDDDGVLPERMWDAAQRGMEAARLTVMSESPVAPELGEVGRGGR